MKKINILIALGGILSFVMTLFICYPSKGTEVLNSVPTNSVLNENGEVDEIDYLYREMKLKGVVNYEAFRQGITGFNRIDSRNKDILALVDFSKPSTEERLFIFDLANREVLFITHVYKHNLQFCYLLLLHNMESLRLKLPVFLFPSLLQKPVPFQKKCMYFLCNNYKSGKFPVHRPLLCFEYA